MVNRAIKSRQSVRNQEACTLKVESESDMKYKISNVLIFVLGMLFAIVVTRKIYRFVQFGTPITLSRPTEPSISDFDEATSFPIILNENDQAISYDFKKLVELFDKCDRIKREFYTDFTPHFARKKDIDAANIQETLKQLYQERASFAHYAWELKGYAKQGLSIKKRRSLVYYQGVIQRNIEELEHIRKIATP